MLEIVDFLPSMFKLNGIAHLRKFYSSVIGDRVRIYNSFDSKNVLVDYTHFSNFFINGEDFDTASDLQTALLSIIYKENISSVDPNQPDALLDFEQLEVDGNEVTIPANRHWRLSGIIYTNTAQWVQEIAPATTMFYRTDIIVANQLNTFQYIQGVESEDNPIAPPVPQGTILVTTVTVFGLSITDIPEPINNDLFVTKKSLGEVGISTGASNYKIPNFGANGENTIRLLGIGNGVITGFDPTPMVESGEAFYNGKILRVINNTGVGLTFKHLFSSISSTNAPIRTQTGTDFRLDNLGAVELRVTSRFGQWTCEIMNIPQKRTQIFINRSGWTFPSVASAPFPLVGSTNFTLGVANVSTGTDNALTALDTQTCVPIAVLPYNCKIKSFIFDTRTNDGSIQSSFFRVVLGSNFRGTNTSGTAGLTNEQVIEDITLPTISTGTIFSLTEFTNNIVIPKGHGVVPLISFSRLNSAVVHTFMICVEVEEVF